MKRLGFDLIFLGTPASGKDTQADILRKKYSLKAIESGKFSRELAQKNTPDGRRLRRTMALGQPTPVPIMKRYIKAQILGAKNQNLIFIGNPRLKPEAEMVKRLLIEKNRDFFAVFIRLPEKEIFRRISARMAKQDRSDDSKLRYIKNRIAWQNPKTNKAVKYFLSLHKLKFINGDQTIKKVAEDIQKAINDYSRSQRN